MTKQQLPWETDTRLLAFLLGLTAIAGQILFLRELTTVFYGNEIAYAVILGSWLFWIAAGSYVAGFFNKPRKYQALPIDILTIAASVALPLCILAIRLAKNWVGVQTGEIIGLATMIRLSFLLTAPLAIFLGGLFTVICGLAGMAEDGKNVGVPARIYTLESWGAAVGGIVVGFVMIQFCPALLIAFLVSALNVAVLCWVRSGYARFWAGVALAGFLFMIISGTAATLDRLSRNWQWQNMKVIAVKDSPYGNIALTKLGTQANLYENGLLSFSTQDPLSREERVHYALLEHPQPRQVLLIGGGPEEVGEVLRHGVNWLEYVQLDPAVVDIIRRYLPPFTTRFLTDPRVRLLYADGRYVVRTTDQTYDVVIVSLSDPHTAMINRYYSVEFFREALRVLNPGGVFAISVSSSDNYVGEQNKQLLQSIETTLKAVFADVIAIPGDTTVLVACNRSGVLTYDAKVLSARLMDRRINTTKYVSVNYLPFKLSADRVAYAKEILKGRGQLNTDMHPVGYLLDIIHWSTHFNTSLNNVVKAIAKISLVYWLLVIAGLGVLVGVLAWVFPGLPWTVAMATTGLSQMTIQLVVIMAFQCLYGYAYVQIGLIMAMFMAGLALGGQQGHRAVARPLAKATRMYILAQAGLTLYPLGLFVLIEFFRSLTGQANEMLFAAVFTMLPVIAGWLGGLQYALATRIASDRPGSGYRPTIAQTGGFLYAMDTWGAALGAFVTGAILIPVLGIPSVLTLCVAVNLVVLALLVSHRT